jgi:hypothetical protein
MMRKDVKVIIVVGECLGVAQAVEYLGNALIRKLFGRHIVANNLNA